jgi:hypothetical protein
MRGEVGERAEGEAVEAVEAVEALYPACTCLREQRRPTETCFVPVDSGEVQG